MIHLIAHLKHFYIKIPKFVWFKILRYMSQNYYGKLKWEFKLGWEVVSNYSLEKIASEAFFTKNINLLVMCAEKGFITEGFAKLALRKKRIDLIKEYNLLIYFNNNIKSYCELKLFLTLIDYNYEIYMLFIEQNKKEHPIICYNDCQDGHGESDVQFIKMMMEQKKDLNMLFEYVGYLIHEITENLNENTNRISKRYFRNRRRFKRYEFKRNLYSNIK